MDETSKTELKKEKQSMSALDAYLNRVFKLAILAPSIATATAAIYFTVLKIAGWYPNIPVWILVVFDLMDASFMVASILFMKTSFGEDGILKKNRLKLGKIFTVLVIIVQWNFISYMSPMREWWAFMFFFAAFGMFFFDMKMMTSSVIGVSVSTFISWAIVDGLFVGAVRRRHERGCRQSLLRNLDDDGASRNHALRKQISCGRT